MFIVQRAIQKEFTMVLRKLTINIGLSKYNTSICKSKTCTQTPSIFIKQTKYMYTYFNQSEKIRPMHNKIGNIQNTKK